MPKTAEIDQTWPLGCYRRPRSRSCLIRDRQQSTRGPLIPCRKRNNETRDRGGEVQASCVVCPQVSFTQGRASAVSSLEAGDQGTMRTLLTVVDTERARPREAGTERWPTFCGLRRFAANLKHHWRQRNAYNAKPRKPQNRCPAKTCADSTLQYCRTVLSSIQIGLKTTSWRKANLPVHSQPTAKPSLCLHDYALLPHCGFIGIILA